MKESGSEACIKNIQHLGRTWCFEGIANMPFNKTMKLRWLRFSHLSKSRRDSAQVQLREYPGKSWKRSSGAASAITDTHCRSCSLRDFPELVDTVIRNFALSEFGIGGAQHEVGPENPQFHVELHLWRYTSLPTKCQNRNPSALRQKIAAHDMDSKNIKSYSKDWTILHSNANIPPTSRILTSLWIHSWWSIPNMNKLYKDQIRVSKPLDQRVWFDKANQWALIMLLQLLHLL